jgi:branched-subunit amino acid aminotransferase/4-amino-4-deoxychorismate lyase
MHRDPASLLTEHGICPPADAPLPVLHDVIRIHWLLWRNGALVPRERFAIDPADEGLLFGRGVWESTRTVGGVPWLWDDHVARLRGTAEALGIDLTPHRLPDSTAVTAYVRALTAHMDVVVRLNVTAGPPGRPGVVWMAAQLPPVPPAGLRLQTRPIALREDHPHLSGKTFHYAYRFHTADLARRDGYDSSLLLDPAGNVLEASHANVFLRFDDGWRTPALTGGLLLPGTVRGHLLRSAPVPVTEAVIPATSLGEVREAFLTNSNVGLVPVTAINDRSLSVGPQTLELKRWLTGATPVGA